MSLDFYLVDKGQRTGVNFRLANHNITHNLNTMFTKAGVYNELWRPNEGTRAKDILPKLKIAYQDMLNRPDYYRQFDSPNGWGTYDVGGLEFIRDVIESCEQYPEALVEVCR